MKASLSGLLQRSLFISALFLFGLPAAHADTMESQSPIDIRSDNTYFGTLPALQFALSTDTPLTVINNGSPGVEKTAVRANVNAGAGSLTLSGHEWDLAQFHFHTPSEHLLNGKASPMEMHLVFSDVADNLLVVSRWVKEGSFNSALGPIFSHIPQTTTETLHVDHFDLNTLVPDNLQSFRYSGSLTTPPFSEGVSWVDLAEPLYMSEEQINAFSSLFPEGDAREIQDLNDRIILTDVPGFVTAVPEPETYVMLLAGLALIGFIYRKRQAGRDDVIFSS
ncbi:carbonic anhydrase [Nitrosovibrio sp. Nv6]|uniref:carbonic anhydrase n=1 Tax=Nitrosovibrio sp. Nv6 TaxID=1855340 RepID=UPI0008CDD3FE|nr:carbonic anhydrase family protein [Nitrosovibrio sp. Nv6]SEP04821.1 carbonic anhydrase [Nitrosovibrio sp. Nv6]